MALFFVLHVYILFSVSISCCLSRSRLFDRSNCFYAQIIAKENGSGALSDNENSLSERGHSSPEDEDEDVDELSAHEEFGVASGDEEENASTGTEPDEEAEICRFEETVQEQVRETDEAEATEVFEYVVVNPTGCARTEGLAAYKGRYPFRFRFRLFLDCLTRPCHRVQAKPCPCPGCTCSSHRFSGSAHIAAQCLCGCEVQ